LKTWHSYSASHYLVNRIYDMLVYFDTFKEIKDKVNLKKVIRNNLNDICYIEDLARYFSDKLKKNYKNVELRCNLIDLIYDLDCLKQYVDK